MSQYEKLAQIYDYLMLGIDYDEWADYVISIVNKFHGSPGKVKNVVDLACGTGSSSLSLAKKGFKVTGVDLAPHMLEVAQRKSLEEKAEIDYIEQDMRKLNLPEPADMVVVYQDGLNYMTEEEDLKEVFNRVYAQLKEEGMFIFDINSVDKTSSNHSEVTCYDEDRMTLIWESFYIMDKEIFEISLTGFLKQRDGYYEKFQETHREKYYPRRLVVNFLEGAGFKVLAVYKAFTFDEGKDWDNSLFYVAQKP